MTIESQILKLVEQANPENPLYFVQNIVKPMCQKQIDDVIINCNACEIACGSKKSITRGNPNASILIIGESVSQEQQDGDSDLVYPLIDTAGDYLQEVLTYLNINEEQIFYINSVNCFPHREGIKRSSTIIERDACKTILDYTIKVVQPLIIICLGAVAINGINEEIGKHSVKDIRGKYFMYRGLDVMPTFHPGYFNELNGKVPNELIETYHGQFVNDIEKAINDLTESYPDINIIKGA